MSVKFLEKGGCLGVLVASDREPGLGLFRCAKIRKSKYAGWGVAAEGRVRLKRAIRGTLRLVLPSLAAQHCVLTGILSFSNFLPKSQTNPRLPVGCHRDAVARLFVKNFAR